MTPSIEEPPVKRARGTVDHFSDGVEEVSVTLNVEKTSVWLGLKLELYRDRGVELSKEYDRK